MAIERRMIAGIEDIKAVVLECKCGRRVACGLNSLSSFPDYCDCAKEEVPNALAKDNIVKHFLAVMAALSNPDKPAEGPKILFEFEALP
jgi:hypothetical protein